MDESRIQLYMKCPTCGDGSPENAQFCAGCGAKLDEASSSDATSNPRPFPDIWVLVRDARVGFVAGFVWITPFAIWALVSRGRTS